ncbi:predicted protein [Naegleria gruberi]|uniref:Predicted protein n=1 Tax=Naegleria gruberi TaxID=5762 RepID=D2VP86_NAEGR|nr:uncharacterized protein NAEGRDRAFT_70767 [Naegleria gruberi]EFC41316.1 predicted protein [Naegleria gruberi]|eukprot:XP_002674060.1 predicted protein [Naegleria gruberi strain NEG-M]
MGSKSSHPMNKPSQIGESITIQQEQSTREESWIILGTADSGTSTFYYMIERILSNNRHYSNRNEFNHDLQLVCFLMIKNLWTILESERSRIIDLIPKSFGPCLENLNDKSNIDQSQISEFDYCELLMYIWNIPFFRDLFETKWNAISPNISENFKDPNINYYHVLSLLILENLEELISRIKSKTEFFPLALSYEITKGVREFRYNNILVKNAGGSRGQRKKWLCCFNNQSIAIFIISLAELDQYTVEDTQTLRIQESKLLMEELINTRFLKTARKIVIFTKPDILIKKLQKGHSIHLGNYKMRPEFKEIINKHELKKVVNSIVSHYLNFENEIEFKKIHSFHIVNTTELEEVNCVMERILDHNSKNAFISPCLLHGYRKPEQFEREMQERLFWKCREQRLSDIRVLT